MYHNHSQIQRYGVAILAVALASTVMLVLDPWFDMTKSPFVLFFAAVMASAWYGGITPGLLATCLSCVISGYFFVLNSDLSHTIRLGLFLPQAVILSIICEHSRRRELANLKSSLADNEQRYRRILDTASEGIWIINAETKTEYVNQRLAEMLGYTREEMLGRPLFDFIDESLHEEAQDHIQQRQQGIKEKFDFCYRRKDNSDLWATVSTNPILDEQGEFIGSLGMLTDITQRKLVEESLRQSEERFRIVLNHIPDIFVLYDAQGRFQFVNATGLKITGKSLDQLIGRTDEELWPKEVVNLYSPLLKLSLESCQTQTQEVNFRFTFGGKIYTKILTFVPLLNQQGEVYQVLGITYDITEQKEAQQRLQQSEERLQNLAANIPGIIYQYRRYPDGKEEFPYISNGCLNLSEIDPKRFQENPEQVWQLVHPDDLAALQESINNHTLMDQQWHHEWRIITPSGQVKWLQGTACPLQQRDGSVLWEGVLTDITKQKQIEARFRRIFESNMIGMKFCTADGNILQANQAYLNIIGYTQEDMQAGELKIDQITAPEYSSLVEQAQLEINQTGIFTPYEKECIRKDGTRISVLTGGARLDDAAGDTVCFILDLSDRKKLENQLRQQTANLEIANRAKDEFLGVLSHELRTPLSSILGWTQMLKSGKLNQKTTTTAIEAIDRNAHKQKQLIEDLLDISRILQDKLRLNIFPTNLVTVVEAAIAIVRPVFEEKYIDFKFEILDLEEDIKIQSPKFLISGDANRLQQIVYNILDNAAKFTPSRGRVEVVLQRLQEGNSLYAKITVKDTGVGITADFLPYVFERFRQADSTITRKFGGLGLGLAIVEHIVRRHNGKVTAESPGEGQGATFTVQLPLLNHNYNNSHSKAHS